MKKIVAVISRYDKNITNKNVFIMYDAFKNIILDNNLLPINIIPPTININKKMNSKEIKDLYNLLDLCDGIIMQGGDNFYDYDKEIVKYAIKKDKPILGICLGMQSMCSINNNNLNKLNTSYHNQDKDYVHDINIKKESLLYNIIKKEKISVNSYHKEYVESTGIYNITSYSDDGIIESVEYNKNKFNIGVQFHPEKTYYIDNNMKKIFKHFFKTIKTQ